MIHIAFSAKISIVLTFLTIFTASCVKQIEAGDPLLPRGFADTLIPDSDISLYLYLNQGSFFQLPLRLLVKEPPRGFPDSMEAIGINVWVASTLEEFATSISFTSETDVQFVNDLLAASRERRDIWREHKDENLFVVSGNGQQAQDLKTAFEEERTILLKFKYPSIWEAMRLLPEDPLLEPIAAGFIKLDKQLITSLGTKISQDLGDLYNLFQAASVNNVVFAFYSSEQITLPEKITPEFIDNLEPVLLAVARSGLPNFLVSTAFSSLAERLGMERSQLAGHNLYYMPHQGASAEKQFHLFVLARGNIIYLAISASREKAESVLGSIPGIDQREK